jgi:hypothetical protein
VRAAARGGCEGGGGDCGGGGFGEGGGKGGGEGGGKGGCEGGGEGGGSGSGGGGEGGGDCCGSSGQEEIVDLLLAAESGVPENIDLPLALEGVPGSRVRRASELITLCGQLLDPVARRSGEGGVVGLDGDALRQVLPGDLWG